MNTKLIIKLSLAFVSGAGTGVAGTYLYLNKKLEDKYKDEIDKRVHKDFEEFKKEWLEKFKNISAEDIIEPLKNDGVAKLVPGKKPDISELDKNDNNEYKETKETLSKLSNVLTENEYTHYSDNFKSSFAKDTQEFLDVKPTPNVDYKMDDPITVIDIGLFTDPYPKYAKEELIYYYLNGVLAEDTEEHTDIDASHTIGIDARDMFDEDENLSELYVRNNTFFTDYHIIKSNRDYDDVLEGVGDDSDDLEENDEDGDLSTQ